MAWLVPVGMAAYGAYKELTADKPAQGSTNPNAYGDPYGGQAMATPQERQGYIDELNRLQAQGGPDYGGVDPLSEMGQSIRAQWDARRQYVQGKLTEIDTRQRNKDALGFGGSAEEAARLRQGMIQQGQADQGQMMGIGDAMSNNATQLSSRMLQQGQQAQATGLGMGSNAGLMASQLAARAGAAPNTFGNQGQMGAWQNQASRLGQFDAGQADGRLGQSYGALSDYAAQGPGPSAAEAQMQAGANANMAQQVALARSGRGAGANAMAMRDAAFRAADIGQRNVVDTATLRAQEAATWRNQQLQAMQGAGSIAGTIDASQQGRLGLGLNAQQAAADQYGSIYGAGVNAQAAAQNSAQNWYQLAGNQQQNQYAQTMGAYGAGMDSLGNAASTYQAGAQGRAAAYQAGQAANAGYLSQYYGTYESEAARANQLRSAAMGQGSTMATANMQNNLSNRQFANEQTQQNLGMIAGAASAYGAIGGVKG